VLASATPMTTRVEPTETPTGDDTPPSTPNGVASAASAAKAASEPLAPPDRSEPASGANYLSTILLIVGCGILALFVLPRIFGGSNDSGATPAGTPSPGFTVEYVSNAPNGARDVKLADLQGKVVLIDFWATWCGPCRAEAPVINRVYAKYADRQNEVAILGINTDDEDGNAAEFVHSKGLKFPMAFDRDRSAANAYGIRALPTLIVLSKSGKVVARHSGTASESELESLIQQAMGAP
jgi:cytochrome c biogenesis protein CcmG, thiol:disulfide interchange protein DsbE